MTAPTKLTQVTGGRIIANALKNLGVERLFALPGAQTMGLYDEVRKAGGISIHSAVQDGAAVGLADGYARATNRLAAVSVYEFAGFANAVSHVYAALIDRTPLLVLGTLTDQRQAGRGWSAEIPNIIGYAQQVTKLAIEVPRVDRIEEMLRRAAAVAMTPPYGPVYVGIPANLFVETASDVGSSPKTLTAAAPPLSSTSESIQALADRILREDEVIIVAGGDIATPYALDELGALSRDYAIPVYHDPYFARAPMRSDHPFYFRTATPRSETYRNAKLIVAIGAKLGKRFSYFPYEFVADGQALCHIHSDSSELLRVYPTEIAIESESGTAVAALREALSQRATSTHKTMVSERARRLEPVKARFDRDRFARREARLAQSPADPSGILYTLGQNLRPTDILVDETIGMRHWWPTYLDLPRAENLIGTNAGFMGWGAAAATGIAMSMKEGKAVLLAGDGCFVMGPQALWSAAHEKAPVVFIVLNNGGWICLKVYYDVVRNATGTPMNEERIGCDFNDPQIDYMAMARGFGVPGRRVGSAVEMSAAMKEAFSVTGPFLIDVVLAEHTESAPFTP